MKIPKSSETKKYVKQVPIWFGIKSTAGVRDADCAGLGADACLEAADGDTGSCSILDTVCGVDGDRPCATRALCEAAEVPDDPETGANENEACDDPNTEEVESSAACFAAMLFSKVTRSWYACTLSRFAPISVYFVQLSTGLY